MSLVNVVNREGGGTAVLVLEPEVPLVLTGLEEVGRGGRGRGEVGGRGLRSDIST